MTDIVPLGDVVKIRYGYSFPASDFSDKGIPVIRMSDLRDYVVDTTNAARVPEHYWDKLDGYRILKGDLIIGMSGSVGKLGIYNDDKPALQNQRVGVFVIKSPKEIDRDYLKYFAFTLESKLLEISRGVAVKNVSAEEIESFKLPLPPLTEQKRIASLLARADRLRQLRRTAHDLGDALLQSVFLEMFGDLTINQKNWDLFFLEDIADVHGGIQVTSTRNSMKLQKPYLRVANVYRNQLELSEIKMIGLTQSEFERTKLQKDDLLFVEGHGNINEIGRAAVWDGSIEDCVHQNHLICARLDLKLANPVFVSHYVNSPAGKNYFTNISNTTSGLNTISTNTVRSCPIPLPPLSLQEEFAGVVARVESLRGRMGESERQVEGLFESLLSESFGG